MHITRVSVWASPCCSVWCLCVLALVLKTKPLEVGLLYRMDDWGKFCFSSRALVFAHSLKGLFWLLARGLIRYFLAKTQVISDQTQDTFEKHNKFWLYKKGSFMKCSQVPTYSSFGWAKQTSEPFKAGFLGILELQTIHSVCSIPSWKPSIFSRSCLRAHWRSRQSQ